MKSSLVSVDLLEQIACIIGRNCSKVTRSSALLNNELLHFALSRVLAKCPHDVSNLGDGDLSISALVIQQEGFLELSDLILAKHDL